MGALFSPTSDNFVQKTLGATLLAGATTVTLNNVTNIPNLPGAFIVDRINSNDVETPNAREVISYTGVSGSTLTGLTRNADGSGSDQEHAINAIVEFGPDILWAQSIYDALTKLIVASTGLLDTTKVVDLTTAQTLTNKLLTSPVLTTPQINDTSLDHQYVFAPSELAADRTVTLPLLLAADTFVFADFIQTLTNKRVTKRILSAASYTTDTGTSLNCDNLDWFIVTAQAGALKLNNPTGTPTDGQLLAVAIRGTAARALTYDTQFVASTTALPSTTVTTARLNMLFVWSAADSQWIILAAV